MIPALIAAGLALATLYLTLQGRPTSWLRTGAKTGATLCLVATSFLLGAPWLALALFFCAAGDFALSRPGDKAFIWGIVFFAAAHLGFTAIMLATPTYLDVWRWIGIGLVSILFLSTRVWLVPHAGALAVPVRVYTLFIVAMGLSALIMPPVFWPATTGALAFIASDLVLAVETFRKDRAPHWSGLFVWVTYFGGLLGLLAGLA